MTYKPIPTTTDSGTKKVTTVDRSLSEIAELQLIQMRLTNLYLSQIVRETYTEDDIED